ncbi:MAG TPA: hypothetical protein GX504_04660 [Clostridia bacterium]|nr:hypothetical protein [Clostridia bacterium]
MGYRRDKITVVKGDKTRVMGRNGGPRLKVFRGRKLPPGEGPRPDGFTQGLTWQGKKELKV